MPHLAKAAPTLTFSPMTILHNRQRQRSRRESDRKTEQASHAFSVVAETCDDKEGQPTEELIDDSRESPKTVFRLTRLPIQALLSHQIKSVACGWDHTIVRTGMKRTIAHSIGKVVKFLIIFSFSHSLTNALFSYHTVFVSHFRSIVHPIVFIILSLQFSVHPFQTHHLFLNRSHQNLALFSHGDQTHLVSWGFHLWTSLTRHSLRGLSILSVAIMVTKCPPLKNLRISM